MTATPNLNLPYMLAAQSQKHVTHNETLRMLDCITQLGVLDRNISAPPISPADGDRYIVGPSPTGAWSGQADKIAAYQDAAWMFYAAEKGWLAWVADESAIAVFDGVAWALASSGGGASDHGMLTGLADDDHPQYHNNARGDARYTPIAPTIFGVNATADTTNRFALASAASLFNHAGNGHQVKINKHVAADTASFLFQTGFSGRAEFGTTGDDDFHLKVSPDGTAWFDAIKINRGDGKVTFVANGGPRDVLQANRTYYVRTDGSDSNTGLANTSGGAFLTIQKAINVALGTLDLGGYNVTIQVGSGTYTGAISFASAQVGAGQIKIAGDTTTPSNVHINVTGAAAISVDGAGCRLFVEGVKLTATSGIAQLYAKNGGFIRTTGKNEFGACNAGHRMCADLNSVIEAIAPEVISGTAAGAHYLAGTGGAIFCQSATWTASGTAAQAAFANAGVCGAIYGFANSASGTFAGARYSATLNGVIQTNGGGANYFPGSSAGSTATGGQYA